MKKLDLFGSSSPFAAAAVIEPDAWARVDDEKKRRERGEVSTREAHLKAIQEGAVAKR